MNQQETHLVGPYGRAARDLKSAPETLDVKARDT